MSGYLGAGGAQNAMPRGDRKAREWLFCIPMQVGPPTETARSLKYWLWRILFLQAIALAARVYFLVDIIGGLWMGLTIAVGIYAYREDMNITYICAWGSICLVNGLFDVLGTLMPAIAGVLSLKFGEAFVRVCVPLTYFIGALFAWHLYKDFAQQEGIPVRDFGVVGDPFSAFLAKVDSQKNLQPRPQSATSSVGPSYGGMGAGDKGHEGDAMRQSLVGAQPGSTPGLTPSGTAPGSQDTWLGRAAAAGGAGFDQARQRGQDYYAAGSSQAAGYQAQGKGYADAAHGYATGQEPGLESTQNNPFMTGPLRGPH